MRVIHIIKATGVAGAERHLLDLLPGLRARGCDARLLVLTEPGRPVKEFIGTACERGVSAGALTIMGDLDLTVPIRLWCCLRRVRPDLVHTHLIHADFYGIPTARLAGVPAVVTTRHDDLDFRRRFAGRCVNRWLWARTDGGIAVSRALARFSTEVEGAAVPIRVIHHGTGALERKVPDSIRAELALPASALVVGMVCRLTAEKGVSCGLQAFAAVASSFPHAVLLISGDGPQRSELERTATDLGLGRRARFLGWRADGDRILEALDLLIAPSRREGFGLVVLEAMARGVPVLATHVGALPEVIEDGKTGLLVGAGDVDALATVLAKLLEDACLRKRLGDAGRERACREFGLSRMVDQTLEFYEEILARKKS